MISLLSYSQIIAIVMDNASNNNTLMTSLEQPCQECGISFSAKDACMHCMPHTVHLAAIKVFMFLVPNVPNFKFIHCLARRDWGFIKG